MSTQDWLLIEEWLLFALIASYSVQGLLALRVVMRRRSVGVTFAWLTVILAVPVLGAVLYLLIGELRLGGKRAKRAEVVHGPYQDWLRELHPRARSAWDALPSIWVPLARLSESAVGVPPLAANATELLASAEAVFTRLIADIDAAQSSCHLEFYIWTPGGRADDVAEALKRAAARGLRCRLLVDDVGSRDFLNSRQAEELREAGIHVHAALSAGMLRAFFVRYDLRLHRKLVVIDGRIGYAGSMNLVDPRFFKRDAGVGSWVDAMVRVTGPAVEALALTFLEDWECETGETLEHLKRTGDVHVVPDAGNAVIQVLPSGPVFNPLTIQEVLLMVTYRAQRELVLTTPYFIPDEPLEAALIGAARRGVRVTLIVPAVDDSLLVRFASQAYRGHLAAAGVRVMEFHGGLLHTKTVVVDDELSLIGSLNLDPRSFFINFEITLAIFDRVFAEQLNRLHATYLESCRPLDIEAWRARPLWRKFAQNTARLLGPLL